MKKILDWIGQGENSEKGFEKVWKKWRACEEKTFLKKSLFEFWSVEN